MAELSTALPIAAVSCTCHDFAPFAAMISKISRKCGFDSALICVLTPGTIPTAATFRSTPIAWSKLPLKPRRRSWTSRGPSIETPSVPTPAAAAALIFSKVSPRPPVWIEQCIPASAIALTIVSQSRRRYASPPIRLTSRVPSSASCRTTSRHSSVESSSCRGRPAREPQWAHFRLQASVISHTT